MNILAVGDLVGENGLAKLEQVLPKIKREYNIDLVKTLQVEWEFH